MAEHRGVPSIPARGQNSNDLTAKRVLQEGGEKGQMGTGGPGGTLSPSSRNQSPERGADDGRAAGMAFHTPPSPAQIPIPAALGVLSTGSCTSCAPRVLPGGLGRTLYPKYPTLPLFWQSHLKPHGNWTQRSCQGVPGIFQLDLLQTLPFLVMSLPSRLCGAPMGFTQGHPPSASPAPASPGLRAVRAQLQLWFGGSWANTFRGKGPTRVEAAQRTQAHGWG